MVHPPQDGKDKTPEESLFVERETAVEVDEERFPLWGDEDIPFVSQIQVEHSPRMDLSKYPF